MTINNLSNEQAAELAEDLIQLMTCDNRDNLLPAKTLDLLWEIDFHENGSVSGDIFELILQGDNGTATISVKDLGTQAIMRPFAITFDNL